MNYLDRRMLSEKECLLDECPCCGGTAEFVEQERPDPPAHYHVLYAQCIRCGLRTKEEPCDGFYGYRVTPEQIASWWNKRHYLRLTNGRKEGE